MGMRKSAIPRRASSASAWCSPGRSRFRCGPEPAKYARLSTSISTAISVTRVRPCRVLMLATWTLLGGCVQPHTTDTGMSDTQLRQRAMECLKASVQYRHNPVVRVAGVEALERCGAEGVAPWIRSALLDEHPAVRFAACVAVGRRADATAESALRIRLGDKDASVQAAALFALHRLGYTDRTGRIPIYLLDHEDPAVRRNAAFLLGLMEEPGAVKMLARAMKDTDAGVRNYALEALAGLGNVQAKQELTFMTNAGVGADEVFAIQALAATKDPTYLDTFRYKLHTASHLETKLAAARGLGILGSDEGFIVALRGLRITRPTIADPQDPPAEQLLRVRQLAARALGAIGRAEALPALAQLMEDSRDARMQVSAAEAIATIIRANRMRALPFAMNGKGKRR